jgi:ATP-binding cassette, subfamily F, member 3
VLERGGAADGARSNGPNRRHTRRLAAERRRELDPLRQKVRLAEETVARLTREREALDRALVKQQGNGISPAEALKRRAELVRLIERAETDWLAAAEAMEREASA